MSLRSTVALLCLGALLAGCASEQTGTLAVTRPPPALPRVAALPGGERDHGAMVAAFGGEAQAPRAKALVEEVVAKLVERSERPADAYTVTLLDSPVANAFALPSGRLYVTRGLLALANDTSELAAVIAHEMAHVARRHAVERGEFEARALLVSRVEADVLGNPKAGSALRERSRATLAGFSRAQELEADALGVATLASAGFDAFGAARFLRNLERAGAAPEGTSPPPGPDMLSTHPATAERIALATRAAQRIGATGRRAEERTSYLAAIDGLAFGDNPSDGLVRGRRFLHPRLGVTFEAPPGYALENTPRAVLGATADGRRRLLFDAVEVAEGQSLADVIGSTWSDAIAPGTLESRHLDGVEAATALSRGQDWTFRLAAIRIAATTYRLILASRLDDDLLRRDLDDTLGSVRAPGADLLARARARHLAIAIATPDDTVATLTARMAADTPAEQFRSLNGLDPQAPLEAGRPYKLVVD